MRFLRVPARSLSCRRPSPDSPEAPLLPQALAGVFRENDIRLYGKPGQTGVTPVLHTTTSYASGTSTATFFPPSVPATLNSPTVPGASNVPITCKVPPAVPEPLTVKSALNDMSLPQIRAPFTTTSVAKAQLLRVVV